LAAMEESRAMMAERRAKFKMQTLHR
jgi:hypothetical protein